MSGAEAEYLMSRPEPAIRLYKPANGWALKASCWDTDISPKLLEFADHNARSMGFMNVETKVVDGEGI